MDNAKNVNDYPFNSAIIQQLFIFRSYFFKKESLFLHHELVL